MTANPAPREDTQIDGASVVRRAHGVLKGPYPEDALFSAREVLAALAVQATETEALKAANAEALLKIHQAREWLRRHGTTAAMAALKEAQRVLTDHGTSPSQDAQEPT